MSAPRRLIWELADARYPAIDAVIRWKDGDTVATVTHEGISYTVRMVTPYSGVSRGFAQVRDMVAWTRRTLKHYGVTQ